MASLGFAWLEGIRTAGARPEKQTLEMLSFGMRRMPPLAERILAAGGRGEKLTFVKAKRSEACEGILTKGKINLVKNQFG